MIGFTTWAEAWLLGIKKTDSPAPHTAWSRIKHAMMRNPTTAARGVIPCLKHDRT